MGTSPVLQHARLPADVSSRLWCRRLQPRVGLSVYHVCDWHCNSSIFMFCGYDDWVSRNKYILSVIGLFSDISIAHIIHLSVDPSSFLLLLQRHLLYFHTLCLSEHRYTGWLTRGMVSATTYTLVGVLNKFLTVLLNTLLWDKHSSSYGLLGVCICLSAGAFYQQAPMRDEVHKEGGSNGKPAPEGEVEAKIPLLKNPA